jgi:diadenosine tetraphosphate (Ap4A) HIT family hydrolase
MLESAVRKAFNADGSMLYVLNGVAQHIHHLHIHIIPRYKNDRYAEKISKNRDCICPIKDRKTYAKRIIQKLSEI